MDDDEMMQGMVEEGRMQRRMGEGLEPRYLIWSNEHRAWWGPGRSGYVRRASQAGRYSHDEAIDICADAIPGQSKPLGMLPELPVREIDVLAVMAVFRGIYPHADPEAS